MSWNYRIIKHHEVDGIPMAENAEPYFAVHEVYYDKEGNPQARTEVRDGPHGESPEDVIDTLRMMLKDCENTPVIEEPFEWKGFQEPDLANSTDLKDFLKELEAETPTQKGEH